jgi:YebC/PmpR family DNA-binding regulatory protein
MGRAFEYRKAAKMKRWAGMAKAFTKVGREINIAIKEGGPEPDYNPRLRLAMNNAKAVNMPKANIDAAIKRATDKDTSAYEEVTFEGYGPHGIAVFIEATSDNNNRTVASIRHAFSKYGGSLGTNGSVDYMFEHKGQFIVKEENFGGDLEELELELIDFGLNKIEKEDDEINLYTAFEDFATQKLTDAEVEDVLILIEKLEEDDDVASVFHTMDESE